MHPKNCSSYLGENVVEENWHLISFIYTWVFHLYLSLNAFEFLVFFHLKCAVLKDGNAAGKKI